MTIITDLFLGGTQHINAQKHGIIIWLETANEIKHVNEFIFTRASFIKSPQTRSIKK